MQTKQFTPYPLKPWVVYEDEQRVGQFMILRCCTAVTPVTLLTFAGHSNTALEVSSLQPVSDTPSSLHLRTCLICLVSQMTQQPLMDHWNASDDDSDDIDEDEIRQVCSEYSFPHMADHLVGFNQAIKNHKKLTKPRKHNVVLKLSDTVGFTVESYASQLLLSMRQKFQVKIKLLLHKDEVLTIDF